eukprot:1137380-Pelagomonas_calceolata.AAC.4
MSKQTKKTAYKCYHICADVGSRIGLQIILVQRAYPELTPMMCLTRGEAGSGWGEPHTQPQKT